ncbi:MAG: dephospho-CoA kinase [Rickettsiaceae bacterium H1]|nr:dephospho-CoA kinase [Rickettsiaceae bacterium H1]
MKIIGVTGAIASGKNLVSFYLKEKFKFPVFDADAVVHDLYRYNRELILQIGKFFPDAIEKSVINRKKLIKYLIKDLNNLVLLENIVHPIVMKKLHRFIFFYRRLRFNGVVINMPLLFKVKANKLCDIVIVVKTNPGIQNQRLIKRTSYNDEIAKDIIFQQHKCNKTTCVIKTGLEKCYVLQQLLALMTKLQVTTSGFIYNDFQ